MLTSFPGGVSSFGQPVLPGLPAPSTGNVFFVNSAGPLGDGTSPAGAYATCALAQAAAVANNGDIVFVMSTHAETIAGAAGIAFSKAGIRWIFLGEGANRPTFTYSTSTAAQITVTAASVKWEGAKPILVCNIDQVVAGIAISAADCSLAFEWQDSATNKEAVTALLGTAAADRLTVDMTYRGQTGGSHCVAPIQLVGTDGALINIDFYGLASTAVVNFITTASTGIEVYGYAFNSGDTTGAKLVVDTQGAGKWFASVYAGAAGASFSGGSAAAMASDDVSSVAASIGTITNTGGTATIGGALGDMANVTLATRTGVPTADVTTDNSVATTVGRKTDAGVTAVGTTKSIMAYVKGLITMLTVQVADSVNNAFAGDVTGNKTDTALFATSATGSIVAYLKGLLSSGMRQKTVALANTDMTGTTTRFTITGGPILVRHIGLLLTTALPAGANTLKFSFTPAGGGATDLCGATDTASGAIQQEYIVDGTKATALVKAADAGIGIGGTVETKMPLTLSTGIITTVFSAGPPASGAGTLYMEWEPLSSSSAVA